MADALDVISLAEAKLALNMSADNADHEAELASFVTAVSRRFDELIGPVVTRSVTEYHDGGYGVVYPRQTPVSSITSVTEWDGTTSTTLTADAFGVAANADGYLLEQSGSYAHDAKLVRLSSGSLTSFTSGRRSVQLIYVAGRAANTAAVDARIKQTAAMVLQRLWKPHAGAWAQSPDFLENFDANDGAGSFKPFDRIIEGMLADELKPPAIA